MTDAELIAPPAPSSVSDCRLTRERSREAVNRFLDRHHPRGGVPGWKACFGARYDGHLVGCVVLSRPVSRYNDDGETVAITRYGVRDDRPQNLGSWLIARGREWARLEGYEQVLTFAGVAGEHGTTYEAAGFDCTEVATADGGTWTGRDQRDSWADYERRKYVYEFDEPLTP
jgi:GNAT superfamily N-acetyltransferase